MTRGRAIAGVLLVVCVLTGARVTLASDASDEALARQALREGRIRAGLRMFEDLYSRTENPLYLRYLGRCHRRLGNFRLAISLFERYLDRAGRSLPRADRAMIEGYIAEMKARRKRAARRPAAPVAETASVALEDGGPPPADPPPVAAPSPSPPAAAPPPAAPPSAPPPASAEVGEAAAAPGADRPSALAAERDRAVLGGDGSAAGEGLAIAASEDRLQEDPLKIGGLIYLRAQATAMTGETPDRWTVASPALVDAYLDARPSDRVRGYLLARMQSDPMLGQTLGGPAGPGDPAVGAGAGNAQPRGTRLAVDQLWVRFDLKHRVFVTAGRQHVRWGTARLWMPADLLHEQRRNPLDVFDARTGSTMLKLHVPWEARSWNLYAYAVTEKGGPKLEDVAGALRAEIVLGTSEAGAGILVKRRRKPRMAADLSLGILDVDLYGEVALRYGSEIDRVAYEPLPGPLPPPEMGTNAIDRHFPAHRVSGIRPQVTGGLSYSHRYADRDLLTIGCEYFYNALGYDDPSSYPGLVLPRGKPLADPATFFYLGRHYAGLFVLMPQPYSWDLTTFTLSTVGNLSDRSFVSRLDYSVEVLTHIRFEAFLSVAYGRADGELRFGIKDLKLGDGVVVNKPPALLSLGIALRLSL